MIIAPCDEPRYSRKSKRVIIPVEGFDVSIPLIQLDAAIETAQSVSDGDGALQTLLDDLHAQQKYGRKKRLRGNHDGREDFFYTYKYAAAWTYVTVQSQMPKPPEKRLRRFRAAERALSVVFKKWKRPRPFQRRIYVTALLVEKSPFGTMRRQEGLIKRIADWDKFNPRNWHRDYIKPRLGDVRRRVRRDPTTLDRLGNAYLREVFNKHRKRHV